jgi:hypothetical protein
VKIMFNNSDSDNDTYDGHTHSGRSFREVPLANLFKKKYGDKGFYSGEEEYLIDEEQAKSARIEEVGSEELHQGEIETSCTVHTFEVSTITPPVVLEASSNQSSQSTVTRSLVHTQSRNQGRSMEDEMRLPIFIRDGSKDPDHH